MIAFDDFSPPIDGSLGLFSRPVGLHKCVDELYSRTPRRAITSG